MKLFGRQTELANLEVLAKARHSFMLHGPMGVGKTRLLDELLPTLGMSIRLSSSKTAQHLFQELSASLWTRRYGNLRQRFKTVEQLQAKTAVSLKGICFSVLKDGHCTIVLEHVGFGSQQLAAAVKQLALETGSPLIFASRSAHMDDGGYVVRLFADRSERVELHNFEPYTAKQFAAALADESNLSADNRDEFLAKVVELSGGNPGAITAMIRMGCTPKYRSADSIKTTVLYIDFRLATAATV